MNGGKQRAKRQHRLALDRQHTRCCQGCVGQSQGFVPIVAQRRGGQIAVLEDVSVRAYPVGQHGNAGNPPGQFFADFLERGRVHRACDSCGLLRQQQPTRRIDKFARSGHVLRPEVLVQVRYVGLRRLAVVPCDRTHPKADSAEHFRVAAKPPLFFGGGLQEITPVLHAQAVVAYTGKSQRSRRLTLQALDQIKPLSLKADGELAQVVQCQPEREPIADIGFVGGAELLSQPGPQSRRAIEVHPANGGDVEAMVGKQMQVGPLICGTGFAPVLKTTQRRH